MTSPRGAEHRARVVVVTGAAAGIGLAIARRFVALGDTVVVADIDGDAATSAAAELDEAADGSGAVGVTLDVADPVASAHVLAEVAATHGPVDVLCNNAGVMDGFHPVGDVSDELWQRVLAVNLSGPFHLSRAVLPAMVERGAGVIVNVVSVAGLSGGRAGAAYTASKHGAVGLTRSIAWHYAGQGIRCNAVCPGPVQTTITDRPPDHSEGRQRAAPLLETRLGPGQPHDIAAVVVFLASGDAAFVNGAVVSADGGWMAG